MYLSRLILSVRSRKVQQDLSNVHAMHQRVLSVFPDATDCGAEPLTNARRTNSVLYRLDQRQDGSVSLLVQSKELPDWSLLPGGYVEHTFEPNPASKPLQDVLEGLTQGQQLRFRARVNATKRLHLKGKGVRGKRVELFGEQRLLEWLLRKAEQNGFAVCRTMPKSANEPPRLDQFALRISEEPKLRGRRAGVHLTFGSTLLEGQLVITEPTLFREALGRGVGAAKAYGFGLISIAPAPA